MAVMAKKKSPHVRPGFKQLGLQMDEDITDAIRSFMAAQPVPAKKHIWTPFFRQAAIEFLKDKGFWPPKPPEAGHG